MSLNTRMLQLLADHATEGLPVNAGKELGQWLLQHPEFESSHFEPAAAAIDLGLMPKSNQPLSSTLRDTILADARTFFEENKGT